MTYDYIGVIENIGETQSFGSNGFTKRELVLGEDVGANTKYPNHIKFTFLKDNCKKLDALWVGERVKVSFWLNGRKWDGPRDVQFFVDLTAIEVSHCDGGMAKPGRVDCRAPQSGARNDEGWGDADGEDSEDLPF